MRLSDIDQLFTPSAVAVFGASDREGSVGGKVYRNLLASGCKGDCYAINPKHEQVAGKSCYKSLGDLNRRVDLALIATPAAEVPGVIDQCGQHGVKAAVVHSRIPIEVPDGLSSRTCTTSSGGPCISTGEIT